MMHFGAGREQTALALCVCIAFRRPLARSLGHVNKGKVLVFD